MSKRLTQEEKETILKLYQEGLNINKISLKVGRSHETVQKIVDPEAAERHRAYKRKWQAANMDKVYEGIRRYQQTEKGKAAAKRYSKSEKGKASRKRSNSSEKGLARGRKKTAKRRAWKQNSIFEVMTEDGWVNVDMTSYLENDEYGQKLFVDPEADAAHRKLSEQAKRLGKIAGVPYHVDHLVPLSRGGEHMPENFALRPASENLAKNNKAIPYDYALFAKRIFNIK